MKNLPMKKPPEKHWWDLTAQDFASCPVWFLKNGAWDEDAVYPWLDATSFAFETDPKINNFLIKATLTFADGSSHPGYIQPRMTSYFPSMRPALFVNRPRQIETLAGSCMTRTFDFWLWGAEPEDKPAFFYAEFQRTAEQIFPIRFSAQPGLTRLPASGEILGFYDYEDWDAETKTVVVRK